MNSQPLILAAAPLTAAPSGKLLEYRTGADTDVDFIAKTVTGFAGGTLVMGFCVFLGRAMFYKLAASWHLVAAAGTGTTGGLADLSMLNRMIVLTGITFVACSLLLVALKVRADHAAAPLFARHWLNSICTGGAFAVMVAGPWLLAEHQGPTINRFVAAGLWMAVMAFPAVAARWTIGPAVERAV